MNEKTFREQLKNIQELARMRAAFGDDKSPLVECSSEDLQDALKALTKSNELTEEQIKRLGQIIYSRLDDEYNTPVTLEVRRPENSFLMDQSVNSFMAILLRGRTQILGPLGLVPIMPRREKTTDK